MGLPLLGGNDIDAANGPLFAAVVEGRVIIYSQIIA
jgi:hypothetical protein